MNSRKPLLSTIHQQSKSTPINIRQSFDWTFNSSKKKMPFLLLNEATNQPTNLIIEQKILTSAIISSSLEYIICKYFMLIRITNRNIFLRETQNIYTHPYIKKKTKKKTFCWFCTIFCGFFILSLCFVYFLFDCLPCI